jgi:hypothetical protein
MTSFHAGDLVRGRFSTRMFKVLGVYLDGSVVIQHATKNGLHVDNRCPVHSAKPDELRHVCLACHGPHHIQHCPQIHARVTKENADVSH